MALPSTETRSVSCTRRPSSMTTSPLTSTRPAAIRSSETRREATPAAAISFCNRMPSAWAPSAGLEDIALEDIVEPVRTIRQQWGDLRKLIDRVDPQLHEHQVGCRVVDGAGLAVGVRLGDEPAAEQGAHHRVDVHRA